ncbi:movement protein [Grapevine emaravirus A]|nr:movement protein [Grapevine emaravirus A]
MRCIIYFLIAIIAISLTMKKVKADDTKTFNHQYIGEIGFDWSEMTELVWDSITSMSLKLQIPAKLGLNKLPISVYSSMYKLYKVIKGQRQTRLATILGFWTPTSKSFTSHASLFVIDARMNKSGLKSVTRSTTGEQLAENMDGRILKVVTFDPNFQQLISGQMDIATATQDIDKLEFYLTLPMSGMESTNSVGGFFDITWKTLPDVTGVYESTRWDVFTFPRRTPPEIEAQVGRTTFEKLKKYFQGQHQSQVEKFNRFEEISSQIALGSDQGLNRFKEQVKEAHASASNMMTDASRRIEAIKLKKQFDDIESARIKLMRAANGEDISSIEKAQKEMKDVTGKYGITVDDEENEQGYIKIGPSD